LPTLQTQNLTIIIIIITAIVKFSHICENSIQTK